jgi:hypothetical protein
MITNKKAQGGGTASSYLISTVIGLGILISIGLMVSSATNVYDTPNIDYFGNYDDYYSEVYDISGDFSVSLDEEKVEEEGGVWSRFKKTIDISRFEDNMFFKTLKAISSIPKLLKSVTGGINQLSLDLEIPRTYINLALIVLGISLTALILQVIRGVRHV